MIGIANFIKEIWLSMTNLLNSYQFEIGGLYIGIWNLLLGFIIMIFVISVFWKGARK